MERKYIHLSVTAIIAFGGFFIVLLLASYQNFSNMLTVTFFSGTVGAVVNNYFRLSKLSAIHQNKTKNEKGRAVVIQIYVSLLLSGILGFVAYGLFLSGLLQGELFPKFSHLDQDFSTIKQMLFSVAPEKNLDAAKAIFWSFIAGFSERFIPNVLDKVVSEAESGEKDKEVISKIEEQ